ncbi:MAG: associated Golgi protein [Caulobacteraceae bacterium]|nr:associated Golgi protein [Caulobacteraceae bacterium]
MRISPALRRALTAFVLFGGVGLVFLFGAGVLGLSGPATARSWLAAASGPWALLAAVACFAGLAFLGVPQFVLIAAAVAAFGPWRGLAYSWTGTMVSALIGFWIGRTWGAGLLSSLGEGALTGFMALVARNGFLASLVIRLVPFAPFIVVNMAAGVTPIGVIDFGAGTAIGILPKIALTALAGDSITHAVAGGAWGVAIGLMVLAGAIWIAASLAARRWMKP